VNVAGIKVYPVAEVLRARGAPFLFLSASDKKLSLLIIRNGGSAASLSTWMFWSQ
jgi:hypothetical protein